MREGEGGPSNRTHLEYFDSRKTLDRRMERKHVERENLVASVRELGAGVVYRDSGGTVRYVDRHRNWRVLEGGKLRFVHRMTKG